MMINDSFLNLLENKLDKYQDKALHTVKNAVIAAGAGSGKTQVLATRFAWLIMTNQAKVDEILTLTFTNKAAAEMYQRIYKTLKMFAEHPVCQDLTEEHKKLAQAALDNFSYAHIQTLDSYCASIVRQCANRYGIRPDFTSGNSDSERNIKDKAFTFILQNSNNPAIQYFALPGKLQDFAEKTFAPIIIENTSLATKAGFFENKLEIQKAQIAEAWNIYVGGTGSTSFYEINNQISAEKNDYNKKITPQQANFLHLVQELQEKIGEIANSITIKPDDIENPSENLKIIISKIEELYNFKDYVIKVNGKIKPIKDKILLLDKANLKSIVSYINQYSNILELNRLLDRFLTEVNFSKRNSGNLTFTDVSELTLKILLENEDIRNQEKNAYKKIMIDEFQDNNGKNRDLLYVLSLKKGEFEENGKCIIKVPEGKVLHDILIREEEKLFFVGDEKQSIYKFRGADVSVFNELSKENETVPMTYNYRSTPELLSAFNTIFKNGNGIFENSATNPEGEKEYEAYYKKNAEKKDQELPELTEKNCPIHILGLFTKELSDNEKDYLPEWDQIGYEIAKRIYEIGNKDGNWNNIAILDKSRTHRTNITKYLNQFGIPYQLDAQKDIFTDAVINDIYFFLRLCVYPSDMNALSVFLCSPFAGLSENSVEKILSYKVLDEENVEEKLKSDISEKEYFKYQNAISFCNEYKSVVLKQKITTTLSYLWNNKGYKYETMLSKETKLCAEHFDMIFELARQADDAGHSVSWFIDQLALLKSNYSSSDSDINAGDINYPIERSQSVKIMSIHKSKGLEFDYVFITGCTEISIKSESSSFFFDEHYGLTLKPEAKSSNYFIDIQQQFSKLKELAEIRRLIYVAITRAKKAVYLMCNYTKPDSKSKSIARLFETMILSRYENPVSSNKFDFYPDAGFDYIPIVPIEYKDLFQNREKKNSLDKIRAQIIKNAESVYTDSKTIFYEDNSVPRNTPSGLEHGFTMKDNSQIFDSDSGSKYEQPQDLLENGNFTAADFGTLVHSYLEMQAKGINPENYEPEPKLFKKLDEKQRQENKLTCITMCREFLESECGQQLEKCKQNKLFFRSEWGFRMFFEGTIFTGSIDLIYENPDGTYTIVDYKSDNQVNPEKYVEQQKCYKTAAAKLLKIDETKIYNFLYFLKAKETIKL